MRASIITPTLNAAAWIDACIANVAQQGDVVLEHIVIDGGSCDGTGERVAAAARSLPHLALLTLPGCGQSAAMNAGIEAASGDVIGILNADDFYQPGAVRRGVGLLEREPAPALVAGDCRIFDAERRFAWNRPDDLRLESLLLGWDVAQFPCNPSAYFYHREVHDIVGGYDVHDHFAMDFDFVLRCVARVNARYVPEHWGNFRVAAGGKTFEDRSGHRRRAAVIAAHVARLDAARRAEMARIGRKKLASIRFRAFDAAPATRASDGITLTRANSPANATVRLFGLLPAEVISA